MPGLSAGALNCCPASRRGTARCGVPLLRYRTRWQCIVLSTRNDYNYVYAKCLATEKCGFKLHEIIVAFRK